MNYDCIKYMKNTIYLVYNTIIIAFLVMKILVLVKVNSIDEAIKLGNILAHAPLIMIAVNIIYTFKSGLKARFFIITTSVYVILLLASIHLIAYYFR